MTATTSANIASIPLPFKDEKGRKKVLKRAFASKTFIPVSQVTPRTQVRVVGEATKHVKGDVWSLDGVKGKWRTTGGSPRFYPLSGGGAYPAIPKDGGKAKPGLMKKMAQAVAGAAGDLAQKIKGGAEINTMKFGLDGPKEPKVPKGVTSKPKPKKKAKPAAGGGGGSEAPAKSQGDDGAEGGEEKKPGKGESREKKMLKKVEVMMLKARRAKKKGVYKALKQMQQALKSGDEDGFMDAEEKLAKETRKLQRKANR